MGNFQRGSHTWVFIESAGSATEIVGSVRDPAYEAAIRA